MRTHRKWIATAGLLLVWAGSAMAATPADHCESSKLKTAGKYGFCRLKAESKSLKTGNPPDYSKCDTKYGLKWEQVESTAGAGACPSEGDQAVIQAFIAQHTDDVATALAGGPLPDCAGDLATCSGDLGGCAANLSSCTGSQATCTANIATCTSALGAAQTDLATCDAGLTTCSGDRATCSTNYASCSADLAAVNAGTALPAEVLAGNTFSAGAGLGLSGTMADNGAVNIIPGGAAQAIAAGYHNGAGTVAGDADLVAGNLKHGVDLFGITGTLRNRVLQTGQTTSYGPGSDGDLQLGTGRSFTDNGDGTITDNTTGLMWEKKGDDGSIHDRDTLYTWGMTTSPYTMNGTMVTTFLAALNSGSGFAGHTDWRIPNRSELLSLMNLQNSDPATYPAFNTDCVPACTVTTCSCTPLSPLWASTSDGAFSFILDFGIGWMNTDYNSNANSVRAVRAGS